MDGRAFEDPIAVGKSHTHSRPARGLQRKKSHSAKTDGVMQPRCQEGGRRGGGQRGGEKKRGEKNTRAPENRPPSADEARPRHRPGTAESSWRHPRPHDLRCRKSIWCCDLFAAAESRMRPAAAPRPKNSTHWTSYASASISAP